MSANIFFRKFSSLSLSVIFSISLNGFSLAKFMNFRYLGSILLFGSLMINSSKSGMMPVLSRILIM